MGISVLMSVYQKEKPEYLRAAIESVINQTLQPDEIVLIKDGKLTEDLEQVIARMQELYPSMITYQFGENVQLGRALAKGVELCTCKLVARMDTDDLSVPGRLECQHHFMLKHPEVSVCGGWMEEFNDDGSYRRIKKMPREPEDIRLYAKYRNPLNHMTVMFRKEDVLACGGYRHFPYLEDYDLWIRMMAAGKAFYNIPEILVKARTNDGVYNRRGGWGYFLRYKELRSRQRTLGLVTGLEYAKGILLSFLLTVQPAWIRKLIYRRVLRCR